MILFFIVSLPLPGYAQNVLQKEISVGFQQCTLAEALKEIGQQAGFTFSYSGKVIPGDSLINFVALHQPIHRILSQLIKKPLRYEVQNNYVIISTLVSGLTFLHTDINLENNSYTIDGFIADEQTGQRVPNVSVYEKRELVSTLTDANGYFKLKVKIGDPHALDITASKLRFRDTTIHFLHTVEISNKNAAGKGEFQRGAGSIENDVLSRFFLSTRQRIQSLNIPNFFASRPFQVSLSPGLSSHGLMSSQVVNRFSMNLAGGYTAGVNGLELGGLFNINKKDARYLQLAGVFNLVGGTVTGLQLAGVNNKALSDVNGIQIAGFMNSAKGTATGMQLSALHNEAHVLKGLQIGLLNVADTSRGVSLGLINIVRNGFYRVTYSANNLMNTNLSLSTGTAGFYSKLMIGANLSAHKQMYAFGLGAGHDFIFSRHLFSSAEVSYLFVNTGVWADRWLQGKLFLNLQVSPGISVMAGPTYNRYSPSRLYLNEPTNFRVVVPDNSLFRTWVGWEAGVTFNSRFKPPKPFKDISQAWYLGAAATMERDLGYGGDLLTGAEIFTQRDLGSRLAATLSVGYKYVSNPDYTLYYSESGQTLPQTKSYRILPVLGGIKTYLNNHLFFGGETGIMVPLTSPVVMITSFPDTGLHMHNRAYFTYTASTGFSFKNGLETNIKFEHYVGRMTLAGIRIAYKVRLSKK